MVGSSTFARWFGRHADQPRNDPADAADVGTAFGMELSFGPPDEPVAPANRARPAGECDGTAEQSRLKSRST
jgi:hypothetical protein